MMERQERNPINEQIIIDFKGATSFFAFFIADRSVFASVSVSHPVEENPRESRK